MEQAHKAVRNMRAQGNKPKLVAYGCFLNACAKAGQVKLAEQCLEYMKEDSIELNTICCCTMINVYASAGDVDKAEECFKSMVACEGEIVPNTSAYNALIKACARVHHIERAEAWFEHMKVNGVEPNVVTFTTLINACAKTRDAERAERWLSEMSKHNVEANLMTYNTVIDACAKEADIEKAELCLQRMRKEGVPPDIVTYNSMINACGKAGDVERAAQWLQTMIQDGLEPCNVSFSTCIGACVKIGDMAAANAVGSNTFNLLVGLPFPWLLSCMMGNEVTVPAEQLTESLIILLVCLTGYVLLLHLGGWVLSRNIGGLMIVAYFVSIGFTLMREFTYYRKQVPQ